jgi:dipeptide/tripeptide permease
MVSVFWALFDQHASTWIEQASQMDLSFTVPFYAWTFVKGATVVLALFGGIWLFSWVANRPIARRLTKGLMALVVVAGVAAIVMDVMTGEMVTENLQAAQISALNPLMVMMIIPGLNLLVYGPLEKRGITVKPLQKMTVGMFMAATAFGVAALIQGRIEAVVEGGERVHVLWQVIQYFVMTTSEVLVSVTGLEFAYTQAPRKMKSTIMGFWLLCVTGGNILVAFLAPMQKVLELSQFFWIFTGLMTLAALLFTVLAYFYKGKTHLQSAPAKA